MKKTKMKRGQASGIPMWLVTLIIIMVLLIVIMITIGVASGSLNSTWSKISRAISGTGLTGTGELQESTEQTNAGEYAPLAAGEYPRESTSISKSQLKAAISSACDKVMGEECSEAQKKAIYGIAKMERGGAGDTISAYNYNFGNLHVVNGQPIYFTDLGISVPDGKYPDYTDAYSKLKDYLKNNPDIEAKLPKTKAYYWSFDGDGKGKNYFVQFEAYPNLEQPLRRKIQLLKQTYPHSIKKEWLDPVKHNSITLGARVAEGLLNGVGGRKYYAANLKETYAAGVASGIREYETLT